MRYHLTLMTVRRLWLASVLLLLLAGCGKVGPVRPLLLKLPSAPENLSLRQQGLRFLLSWELPKTNQDGSPLDDLQGFEVYRMSYDPVRECPECRDTSVLFTTIDLDYLRQVQRSGNRLSLWDTDLQAGSGYQYRIVPLNRHNGQGLPGTIRRVFFAPPPPPKDLTGSGHDQLARLGWAPLAAVPAGGKLLGYNVYRRQIGEPFPPQPVNHQPLSAPALDDFGLTNNATYVYAVRTVVELKGSAVESVLSNSVVVTPLAGH